MATFLTFCVLLTVFCPTVIWAEADKGEQRTLQRQKREWITPPKKLYENVDYTKEISIAKIRSDEETREDIEYSLIGPAVDQGLFSVGRTNGFVRIHSILDREKNAFYELKGRATLRTGALAERDLDLRIIVLDQNDNPPVFKVEVTGSVNENSDEGTDVISITAVDADEPDTPQTQIAYEVIQQEPGGKMMFKVERLTGKIKVRLNTLDRETQETYKLLITGTDMNGIMSDYNNKPLTGTGTVIINIGDVNDNVPVLEKSYYEGSVEENIMNMEVIRINAYDKDKIYTENWEAVYTIVSGNEAGYFNITTDPKTNEGILVVTKELDYEELKELNLKVVVNNKASYHKSVVIDKPTTYPIKIKVLNVPETPHFQPAVKVVYVSEDKTTIDLKKVITTYKATDSDTLLTATNVRYLKGEDMYNWVNIDEHTAEIRLTKYPDRESKYLTNGTYYVKILAITDGFTPKTATGTVAIQVEDFNDHCPILTSSAKTLCYGNSVVYVTATDRDKFPNAEPFDFMLVTKGTKEKWSFEPLNATTVILRSQEILWPGHYPVELKVEDQQGKSCDVQQLQVSVCTCTEAQVCRPARQTSTGTVLGAGGALALLLGILLLLLIPILLLLCECGGATAAGGFKTFPFDQQQQLITYHTEGQGEYKELIMLAPVKVDFGRSGNLGVGWESQEDWRKYGWESKDEYMNQWHKRNEYGEKKATGIRGHSDFTTHTLDSMALSEAFFSEYYAMKTLEMKSQEACENQVLVSNYEDCLSVSSSFGDLTNYLHEDNNLDFLNDLGPRFKRLAEICHGSAIDLEVSSTSTPAKMISTSSQVGVKVEGAVGGVHNEATSVSASNSTSTSTSTTKITTSNYKENISSGGATSAATVGQTLLVQQPTVFFSSSPMYVMEQQHQPALFLASGPNMVLVKEGASDMVISAQNTLPRLGLQQANTTVLVDPGIRGTVGHRFSGHAEPQGTGTFRVVESRRVENMEPVHAVQSFSHSTINKSQSMQAEAQSGRSSALEIESGFPGALSRSQKDAGLFPGLNGGTHKEVREERVSVVKKSFQTSATS